jgi:RimJ/RimL family protein N-acetyltransferase
VPSWWSSTERARLRARRLELRDRDLALARLRRHARDDLFLLDLAAQLGEPPAPGEPRPELAGVFGDGDLVAVASLRPTVTLEARTPDDAVDALLPWIERVDTGLIKSPIALVGRCWARLAARGRRALVDRIEAACSLEPRFARLAGPRADCEIRAARPEDLPALVHAARASLREEGRPDPFDGDPDGFRRWVRGRVTRATVATVGGRIGFVAYADVRRPEGWLVQGVYTWPDLRRRGLALAGVSALCRAAFEAGAGHVQLAVVEGNAPAEGLYARLGFRPFERLRTVLFV